MTTKPRLPDDEAPLDPGTVDLLLSNIGTDMILVGGQALAFWMDRFGVDAHGAAISNDGDALGELAKARALAAAIRARLVLPRKTARTAVVAQLRLRAADGKERNIDVLHLLYTVSGRRKSSDFTRQVVRDSVEVEWRKGMFIRVMDPFDVLESRAQNAVGLYDDKGPHVLTQVKWAIEVSKAALSKLSADPKSTERLGTKVQRIFTLARSQVGRRLCSEHRIELLDAIDVDALGRASPMLAQQLDAVQKARRHRKGAAQKLTPH
jgi:hypothetical protein